MRSWISLSVLALLAACTLGWGGAASAQTQPAAGRFLVATRQQQGFFSKSVILLIAYGPGGAFGLVVNHPTKFTLARALPDARSLRGRADVLYLGGPVSLDNLTLLIRSGMAPPGAIHVVDDVYASGSLSALRAAAGRKLTGARFRGYAGYAGWGPGQLDSELEQGAWVVVPANADDVFTTTPEKLWDKLIQQQNLQLVRANQPTWYGIGRADPYSAL